MTSYQVDSEAVAAATATIRATIDRLHAETAALGAQLLALQSSWTGQAAAGFQAVASDWKATQTRVDESLAGIGVALARAGQHYADVELANVQLFRR